MLSFFAPRFLKRLDQRLLLSSPILWLSKLHYVIYYTVILWLLTGLIALVIPINLADMVNNGIYYTFFTIISIVLLCVWIYRNAIFNIESDYGNRKVTDEYKVFFINFLCVFLLFSYSYPFTYIYNARVANTLSEEELVSEINTLNVAEPFFVKSYYDYREVQIKKDSIIADDQTDYQSYTYKYDINDYHSWNKYTPYRLTTDSNKVQGILSSYQQQLSFNRLRKNDSQALQAIQNYISILRKHDVKFDYEASYVLSRYKSLCREPIDFNNESYKTYDYTVDFGRVETILRNVCDAKFDPVFVLRWEFNLVVFYFVFYITLAFMLFKTVRWQQFLVTVVSFILLPILVFIFSMLLGFGSGRGSETIFMTTLLLIYLVAVGFSLSFMVHPKKFNAFKSICMQIVYVCTPVFFLYLIFYLDENTDIFWRGKYYYNDYAIQEAVSSNSFTSPSTSFQMGQLLYEEQYKYYRALFENLIWASMAFGIFFHISFFMVFMKEQFLKMKALPKNK
ncbi:MAG: hypothetical protein K0S33_249 [Bacteroidetes bacterium]|jgi:hypothetical protein|nr:hypothetical protein [Bacteroidota bacterium]